MDIRYIETHSSTDINAYIRVIVTLDGVEYPAACQVGAPDSLAGTIGASGAGVVRAMCAAEYIDSTDWQEIPAERRGEVQSALIGASWRLWQEAEIVDEDEDEDE